MTVGKDVSMLFTDVVNCMQTRNIELKKLVYLYLINYAKSQPDLAILAVNTFVKDSQDPNPLIRALAVRTMGCIRVEKITEYLCEPLRKALKDDDPYVRKTAAVCVAKLYDINAEMVEDQGFLDSLKDLLSDSNPMVVANAVAALSEIAESSTSDVLTINSNVLQKLLAALNECTEWGQVFILDSLANYTPVDNGEAESIIERVTPRLQHANSAVVLSAVKVIMKYLDSLTAEDTVKALCKKLAPPLVTLLSSEPEVQYVALRNINLIVQKRSNILSHEVKVFFCKYNDPIYVKMEKLETMIRLASERNIDQVLLEFKEYATEVDVEFVRKAVRAIGRCAIKLEKSAERCINVLLELIQTKVNYVVQEAIIVIKDIFRKYPNRYESIIATLCENLDTLDEPEAKASMIWIIGEYADRIDNADELLDQFLASFHDESPQVQLQLLTATVKLFLKKPTESQELVQKVLNMATQESDNPDLRDRGYIYWRLLSTDPEAAKSVVLGDKPVISDDTNLLDPSLLDDLISQMGTLASVFHKPSKAFVDKSHAAVPKTAEAAAPPPEEESGKTEMDSSNAGGSNLLDLDDSSAAASPQQLAAPAAPKPSSGIDDLLGGPISQPPAFSTTTLQPTSKALHTVTLLPAMRGKGMQITGSFSREQGRPVMNLTFENQGQVPLSGFAIQFNKNSFGLIPAVPLQVAPVNPAQTVSASLPLANTGPLAPPPVSLVLQVAVKNNVDVFYFQDSIPFWVLLGEDGRVGGEEFLNLWQRGFPEGSERTTQIANIKVEPLEAIQAKLEAHNIFFVGRRPLPDGQMEAMYLSVKSITGIAILLELTFRAGYNATKVVSKTSDVSYVPLLESSLEHILRT
eukprot:CAMPEP_0184659200 /NCGR_PEP_ID=MMETSP0308-20130426/28715_1 /TAXON_ID=38269 /ORGANISM="Gloeochaete witrockiana, Strain SAG 46.84" /LENGTH=861 /DNA_ID=CAMNT_0027098849 /DNA_START=272 /DNA_END=2857 /DNA_ORIENTATION=-